MPATCPYPERYEEHRWNTRADLKLQQFWLGCKADTLNSAVFNVNGTAERGAASTEFKKWPLCSETTPGKKNMAHPALGDKSKICLPPLHIKSGLIKMYVGQMDKESEGFA